jgi:hypothetical protein
MARGAATWYNKALEHHYGLTTAVQAFALVSAGDVVAQVIELDAHKRSRSLLVQASASTSELETLNTTRVSENGGLFSTSLTLGDSAALEQSSGGTAADIVACLDSSAIVPNVVASAVVDNATITAAPPSSTYDPVRTVRMGLLGLLIGGVGTSNWLRFLEVQLPGHGSLGVVVEKAVLDACLWAPVANGLYLVLTPLLEGKRWQEVRDHAAAEIGPVMKTELLTFFPYNLLNFSLVPPLLRPFTTGFVSMCFSVYLSLVTHQDGPPILPL